MMKDEKGMMKEGKDAMMKDKMKAEQTRQSRHARRQDEDGRIR